MRFARPHLRRRTAESIVPMINIVFLLLIFLLLTARIAPPAPFELTLPEAGAAPEPQGPAHLLIAADGTLALGALRGAAALAAIPPGATLYVSADAALPAETLARLLPRLAAAGEIRLVTRAP